MLYKRLVVLFGFVFFLNIIEGIFFVLEETQ